ncbi:MAG TPA: SLBB domain-containing protein [Verrucomicrobiota bacterium]|nr:SLBB domain-containing protein [Verrucomicrobiota bacterium]
MSITNIGKQLGHWGLIVGLCLAMVGLSGCRTSSPQGELAAPTGSDTPAPEPEVFRIGDSLKIVYSDLPQVTPEFAGKIKEDGTITLLLNKTFTAAGKTAGELEREIRAYYVPNYYKNLTVTVTPVESTRWYYVYGEVRAPNRQIYNSRITVLQAIASAGGFTDFAKKKKIKLTRVDGRTLIVNCPKAQENPSLDLEVYPGDKIYVPRRIW